jgi:two-component system nitrogen regulation response regulator NtrX
MASVLIVDDEANIRRMLAALLDAEGYATKTAAESDEAIAALERAEPDVVLLDLALPGRSGLEVLESLRQRWPMLPVVMMSGRATLTDAVRATKLGAYHFIEKPLTPEVVLLAVSGAVELRRARELSRALAADLRDGTVLVGSSLAMQRTRRLIEQIAPTDARVLITGESGTGKELAAMALHAHSVRAARPFVRVNSAAIPRELVESEMFGHEAGAFTGASGTRRGRFELADRGTLFLDEVADLSAEAQAKLLRAIELGQIERLGSEHAIAVDVRVIAATNRDLSVEIRDGRFRDDLLYRLDVLRIHIPPLRERLEDIPELVDHFLLRFHARDGLAPPRLSDSALRRLSDYSWPGNVRELANVCERIAILHADRSVGEPEVASVLADDPRSSPQDQVGLPLHERLDSFERMLIARSLASAGGNVATAARELRTDRANLYRRMRRLGIER